MGFRVALMENPIGNRKETVVIQLQWDYVAKFGMQDVIILV